MMPSLVKEFDQDRFCFAPLGRGQTRDRGKLVIVGWKFARRPVVHQQQHVRAHQQRAQVAGVAQQVADVDWHLGRIQRSSPHMVKV